MYEDLAAIVCIVSFVLWGINSHDRDTCHGNSAYIDADIKTKIWGWVFTVSLFTCFIAWCFDQ